MRILFASLLLLLPWVTPLQAQTDELLLEFHTTLYADDGESNSFTLALGSTQSDVYVDIDCGYGREEFEVTVTELDEEANITSSTYSGNVSSEGIVRVYGNPAEIDYVNASGCSVTEITFHPDLSLKFLNLEHNKISKLDLNAMKNLMVVYIMDNPFDEEPFNITARLENLAILEIAEIDNISPDFSITQFPNLMSFDAYHTLGLQSIDPSQCPYLFRLSLEMTAVESVDVSHNQNLMVLNVSETRVSSLDLSQNQELYELYCTHIGRLNSDCKFTTLDLSHNAKLEYLFCGGNQLTDIDLSHNTNLIIFSAPNNLLEHIDLVSNPNLYTVNLDGNRMNFATLPSPEQTWGEYYYDQVDLVINDTYKVGDVLDFSAQVLREGTTTQGVIYVSPKDDPTNLQPLSSDYYTYADGKVTLLKPCSEQLRIIFSNSLLADYELYTEPFRVVAAEDFGKDVKALSISSITAEGADVMMAIGILGASPASPVTIQVDLGDDEPVPFVITEENPTSMNVVGKRTGYSSIIVYVPQDHYVSALKTQDLNIGNIDLSNLMELRVLSIVNADLYTIDLKYNAKLEELTLTGNPYLTSLDLSGKTAYYYKGGMEHVNLSHNGLTSVKGDDYYMFQYLDLSHNNLTEFDVTDTDYLREIDLSYNHLGVLQFNNSIYLQKADVSHNDLTYLYITDEAPLTSLDATYNCFAYGSMPVNQWKLTDEQYLYAPQQPLAIPASSPTVDLSAYLYEADGAVTQYVWKNANGQPLTLGTDYTLTAGVTRFLDPIIGQQIYCELSHAAYPQFVGDNVLRTTEVKVIGMPTIELAHFVTTTDDELVNITLSSTAKNTALYIDWTGDGSVIPYMLSNDQVLDAQAYTHAGVNVRVLASEEGDNFRVFSVNGATMSSFDGSGLTEAVLIGVENAGLSDITLPASSNLKELKLSGNKFTSLDLTPYPNLFYLAANSNRFESFDFGQAPKLALAFLANNQISEVTFHNNTNLWNLDLGTNRFSEISFEGAPNIEQLWLNDNQFETLDLSYLQHLLVLDIVGNKFTFATLEHFNDMLLNVFRYGRQADLAVTVVGNQVDLSSQAVIGGAETQYRWFLGKPEINDDGEFEGTEFIAGEAYTVANGVTTFLFDRKFDDLVCVMSNEVLPNLYLYTQPISCDPTAIQTLLDESAPSGAHKELRHSRLLIRTAGQTYNLYGISEKE